MLRSHRKLIAVGVACALAGSAAGIAVTSAATSSSPHRLREFHGPFGFDPHAGGPGGELGALGIAGPPVHSELVVPKSGGGFETVTMDRGTFQSLSGSQLTVTEGTQTATYKTVTLSIPTNATIVRDGQGARLSDLNSGDVVNVAQTPSATDVFAISPSFRPRFGPGFRDRGFRGRFAPGGVPGAPPPAPPFGTSFR